jgi:phosphoribosyl-ATP pyrophosphohydrolase
MYNRYSTFQDKLTEFHFAFGHPVGKKFEGTDISLPISLITEEYNEFIVACNNDDVPNIKKELIDLIYVCISMCVRYGWDSDVMFNLIHKSNMTKLDKNGKAIYREDGKIMKSDQYVPVDLTKL